MLAVFSYLNAGLWEVSDESEAFPHDNIRVMRLRERFLQGRQLLARERRPRTTLLPVCAVPRLEYHVYRINVGAL